MNNYSKVLVQIVLKPAHYRHFFNIPGAFDAAQELVNDYWDYLSHKEKKAVARLLINSGQYE